MTGPYEGEYLLDEGTMESIPPPTPRAGENLHYWLWIDAKSSATEGPSFHLQTQPTVERVESGHGEVDFVNDPDPSADLWITIGDGTEKWHFRECQDIRLDDQ